MAHQYEVHDLLGECKKSILVNEITADNLCGIWSIAHTYDQTVRLTEVQQKVYNFLKKNWKGGCIMKDNLEVKKLTASSSIYMDSFVDHLIHSGRKGDDLEGKAPTLSSYPNADEEEEGDE